MEAMKELVNEELNKKWFFYREFCIVKWGVNKWVLKQEDWLSNRWHMIDKRYKTRQWIFTPREEEAEVMRTEDGKKMFAKPDFKDKTTAARDLARSQGGFLDNVNVQGMDGLAEALNGALKRA